MFLNTLLMTRAVSKSTIPAFTLKLMNIGFDEVTDRFGYVAPYKYGYDAASVISIDFEHLLDKPGKGSLNHQGTVAILRTAEKYGIPLTWGMCGEAVVKDCEAYEQILHSKVKNDIGIHTYSHQNLSDPTCTEPNVHKEIAQCIEVLSGVPKPSTFIFPYNEENYFDTIREHGFTAYRPKDRLFGYPKKKHGMWSIPPTYYLNDEPYAHLELAKRLIDFAIAYNCTFHMWLHPRDVAKKGSVEAYVNSVLEPIFRYMSDKAREGKLWLCTMRELANYCEAGENCIVTTYRSGRCFRLYVTCQVSNPRFDVPPEITLRIPVSNKGATIQIGGTTVQHGEVQNSIYDGKVSLTLALDKQVEWIDTLYPPPHCD